MKFSLIYGSIRIQAIQRFRSDDTKWPIEIVEWFEPYRFINNFFLLLRANSISHIIRNEGFKESMKSWPISVIMSDSEKFHNQIFAVFYD